MLHEDFDYKIKKIGEPQGCSPLTVEQSDFFSEHFPPSYTQFVQKFGLGHYFNRGWQFCDPQAFRPLLALIFKADPDFNHNDCHLAGFSAFGMLSVWSEQHWCVDIDLLKYEVNCSRLAPHIFNYTPPLPAGRRPVTANNMVSGLLPSEPDEVEFWDRDGREMFARCVKAHGPLEAGECFGFVPSLGMTGYNSKYRYVEYVQRLKALEHFCLISQMKDFHLVRHNMGKVEQIRVIG